LFEFFTVKILPDSPHVKSDHHTAKPLKTIATCDPFDMRNPLPALTEMMPDED
jgi:hypothetical protein